ncbi:hypothetical protein CK203_102587 [Vitis vinifera]|uniref:Uncharacterized protein n=1 Tax=Vitis vinifera TaxID=29760 RepID=A0A438DZA7_VITVI|nr:hypothetical protein CK203_102587 [Vitis vinifera]
MENHGDSHWSATSEETIDLVMFSHQVHGEKGGLRNSLVRVIPADKSRAIIIHPLAKKLTQRIPCKLHGHLSVHATSSCPSPALVPLASALLGSRNSMQPVLVTSQA